MSEQCPYCGLHPFEYVDVGIGRVAVAANCCEFGYLMFEQGMTAQEIDQLMKEEKMWNDIGAWINNEVDWMIEGKLMNHWYDKFYHGKEFALNDVFPT